MAASQESELNRFLNVCRIVKKRPGMFVRPVTLENISNFFSGYFSYHAFDEAGEYYDFFENYSPSFGNWVASKEGGRYAPSSGWVECIMKNAKSEDEGIETFFRYIDEYVAEVIREEK